MLLATTGSSRCRDGLDGLDALSDTGEAMADSDDSSDDNDDFSDDSGGDEDELDAGRAPAIVSAFLHAAAADPAHPSQLSDSSPTRSLQEPPDRDQTLAVATAVAEVLVLYYFLKF